MIDGRWIEVLEDRCFLSAGPIGVAGLEEAPAVATVAPRRVAFNVNQLLRTYSGTVTLTQPAGLRPYKFSITISSINVATKLVQGTISLPKLNFRNIALTSKSTFTASTKQFIIRIVSTGTPALQTLSVTLKGTVTAQNLAAGQITGRFSGFVPFNGQPRVQVDGSFTVTKS
jgi:hypothetical protein